MNIPFFGQSRDLITAKFVTEYAMRLKEIVGKEMNMDGESNSRYEMYSAKILVYLYI